MHLGLRVSRRRIVRNCGVCQSGCALLGLFVLLRLNAVDLVFVDGVQCAVGRDGDAAGVHGLADFRVAGQAIEQVLGVPLHFGELGEAGIEVGFVNRGGVQLLIEPLFEARMLHARTASRSPGRGPKVKRLRAWRMRSSPRSWVDWYSGRAVFADWS